MSVKHCHVTLEGPSPDSLQMLLDMNPFSGLMIGWTVMVFAMMLPKLAMPIQNIYETSFKHNRFFYCIPFCPWICHYLDCSWSTNEYSNNWFKLTHA